jgi:hypothetical protein
MGYFLAFSKQIFILRRDIVAVLGRFCLPPNTKLTQGESHMKTIIARFTIAVLLLVASGTVTAFADGGGPACLPGTICR